MSLFLLPRPLPPSLILKTNEAVQRTEKYIFSRPGNGNRFGVYNTLRSMAGNTRSAPDALHNLFEPAVLFPILQSWALLQLYEALQLRAEWQYDQPSDVTLADVITALDAVAKETGSVFTTRNTTPAVRRAVLGIPFLQGETVKDGWIISLNPHAAFEITLERTDRTGVVTSKLPPTVFFNESTKRWDVRPT